MDYSQVMTDLESRGNEKTLALLRRQGADGVVHGVPMKQLLLLASEIGTDGALARELWASGVLDARILAILVADAGSMSADDLDAWARDATFYPLIDHLIHLVVRTRHANQLVQRWVGSGEEFVERCGFLTMAELAKLDRDVDDQALASQLETIEDHIRTSTTRAKEELGAALVTIGRRNEQLHQLALEVARRIGKIEIEHPELGRIESDAVEVLRNPELAKRLIESTETDRDS